MEDVKFSEAAKLFAKNEGVVRAMERKYWADLDEFWKDVLENVLEMEPEWKIEPPGVLSYQNAPNWFQFRRKDDQGTKPYLKIVGTWYSPSIVTEGVIRLECAWDKSTPHQKAAIARGGSALPNCARGKGTASCLFTASIDCKEGTSTRDVAAAIAELSRRLHELVDQADAAVQAEAEGSRAGDSAS